MARSSARWLPRRTPHAALAAVGLRKQAPQRSLLRGALKKLRRGATSPGARLTHSPARRSHAPTRPTTFRSTARELAIATAAGLAFGTVLAMATLALTGGSSIGAVAMMVASGVALVALVAYTHWRWTASLEPTVRAASPKAGRTVGEEVPAQASASAFFGSGSSGSTMIRMA